MKGFFLAMVALFALSGAALSEEVKLGILLNDSRENSFAADSIATLAEMALAEVNASAWAKNTYALVSGESICVGVPDEAEVLVANRMIANDHVKGIISATCDNVETAVLNKGMAVISIYSYYPFASERKDHGLFFTTQPSDHREGEVMADILIEKGVKAVAVAYFDSESSKMQTEYLTHALAAKGITTTIEVAYRDGKADYLAEIAALKQAGGDVLIVVASSSYPDQDGHGLIQAALEGGAFSTFGLTDSVSAYNLLKVFGPKLDRSFGLEWEGHKASMVFYEFAKASDPPFDDLLYSQSEASYDAAALIMLAIEASGSTDPKVYKEKIIEIANGTGDDSDFEILPGDLSKALRLIDAGIPIDYEGTSSVTLKETGEAAGRFRQYEVKDGVDKTVKFR